MSKEDGVLDYVQRLSVRPVISEKAVPNWSGVRTSTKLNSIESEGATALISAAGFS